MQLGIVLQFHKYINVFITYLTNFLSNILYEEMLNVGKRKDASDPIKLMIAYILSLPLKIF